MTPSHILIPATPDFWRHAARALIDAAHSARLPQDLFATEEVLAPFDFSAIRVVVPTFEHAQLLTQALAQEIQQRDITHSAHFIPPVILTMFAWLGMQMPLAQPASAQSERLMSMYGQLRQHEWLKKLFGAQRNTDLLPLAQTLLTLSDELTQVWLPQVLDRKNNLQVQNVAARWQQALSQLPLPVQEIVSEETQLVWTLWQGQLDLADPTVQRFQQMMRLAEHADADLFWIAPTAPNVMEQAFLSAYALKRSVCLIRLDWRVDALPVAMRTAWPGVVAQETVALAQFEMTEFAWSRLALCEASSLEDEAEQAAQTIVDWLVAGKQRVAVIAQDRVASRRLRALLERAGVHVADETGWKLSTTRAAAALAAWFEVLASRADALPLLDFLKSPFLSLASELEVDKSDVVMEIELALRRCNVVGGWEAALSVLKEDTPARIWLATVARLAHSFSGSAAAGRRSLKEWANLSVTTLAQLGMQVHLQADVAGAQLVQMLQALAIDCHALDLHFNFTEWRAFLLLQMENTPFILAHNDKRVMMLPLNGARLRQFDAVYVIGGDARHLPSRPQETLFFSNAVRRECGLVTQEERHEQQLRDFAELLLCNPEVIVSWQSQSDGEFNALSPWLEQVNLQLARAGKASALRRHRAVVAQAQLQVELVTQARPRAAALTPEALSASGFNSLMACPYQFFAGRMLKLFAMDEFSDRPEKRDYGDWLHAILKTYHDRLVAEKVSLQADRVAVLGAISDAWFGRILKQNPAALGYSVRWKKVMPAYVAWANQREADGWQFVFGEVWGERHLAWQTGGVLLRGRLDRLDERSLENGDTERAVLDYKTRTKSALRLRLKSAEDHQLAFYGLLQPKVVVADEEQILDEADSALYVALELEREKTGECEAEHFPRWKSELEQVITHSMQAIADDAELPAQGVEKVCAYCDMRGLCRKGAW